MPSHKCATFHGYQTNISKTAKNVQHTPFLWGLFIIIIENNLRFSRNNKI